MKSWLEAYQLKIPEEKAQLFLTKIDKIKTTYSPPPMYVYHRVRKGDTLYDIARKYKTTVARIKSLNGLRSNVIYPGQKLKLYGSSSGSSLSKRDKYYVVKKGETVGAIAAKLGISQNRIISMNNLKNKNGIVIIHPGQKLYY